MLLQTIETDIVAAMKSHDSRLTVLRQIKTALVKYEKDSGKVLDEAAEQKILATLVKQHKDSIDMFLKGERQELADKETAELSIIESYMPKEASHEHLDVLIEKALKDTGASAANQMGSVMKYVKTLLGDLRADGKVLSEKIKAKLQ